jgi:hypothetical protein
LPPVSAVVIISLLGDEWIATNVAAPVQHTVRLITSTTPLEYTLATAGVEWAIAPDGVAIVDQQGRVSPVAIGTATLTARYGDKTGTQQIRVLPDFSGNWSGQFRITGCSGGFDFRECGRMTVGAGAGTGTGTAPSPFYPFSLQLSQFRDQVTGTVREPRVSGELTYPVSGIIRLNGQLVLEATQNGDSLRVFSWASDEQQRYDGDRCIYEDQAVSLGVHDPYTIRTEHEFTNLSHSQ